MRPYARTTNSFYIKIISDPVLKIAVSDEMNPVVRNYFYQHTEVLFSAP